MSRLRAATKPCRAFGARVLEPSLTFGAESERPEVARPRRSRFHRESRHASAARRLKGSFDVPLVRRYTPGVSERALIDEIAGIDAICRHFTEKASSLA